MVGKMVWVTNPSLRTSTFRLSQAPLELLNTTHLSFSCHWLLPIHYMVKIGPRQMIE